MSVTILQIAPTRRLTRVSHVVRALGGGSLDEAHIAELIDAATAAIERFTHRPGFGRDKVLELCRGYGAHELALARAPLVAVLSVTRDAQAITDWTITDRDAGALYSRTGWDWTVTEAASLGGPRGRGWPGFGGGVPVPGSEAPAYAVTYLAGYLLPEQQLEDVATLEASATDNSFRDTAGGLPALLSVGDVIRTSGFSVATNNGRWIVAAITGTGAAMRVVVAGTLATEAAGGTRSLVFEGPAGCRSSADLERACIETVKSCYLSRGADSAVIEQQVGAMRVRRSESPEAQLSALPPIAVGLLRPWVRTSG